MDHVVDSLALLRQLGDLQRDRADLRGAERSYEAGCTGSRPLRRPKQEEEEEEEILKEDNIFYTINQKLREAFFVSPGERFPVLQFQHWAHHIQDRPREDKSLKKRNLPYGQP